MDNHQRDRDLLLGLQKSMGLISLALSSCFYHVFFIVNHKSEQISIYKEQSQYLTRRHEWEFNQFDDFKCFFGNKDTFLTFFLNFVAGGVQKCMHLESISKLC